MKKYKMTCALLVLALLFGAAGAACSSELLRERAKNLYSVQDYRGALALFDRLLGEIPGDGEALDYSAWCLRYLGDWKSAEERFFQALDAPSGALTSWIHVGLGETYLGAGDERKAVASFQKAIESAPGDDELFLRSQKGIAWAAAFFGEREEYGRALALIREKDEKFAEEVLGDTGAILEEREALAAAKKSSDEPVEPILVLDTMERHAKLYEEEALEDELDEILSEVLVQETPAAEKQEDVLEIIVLDDVKTGGDVASSGEKEETPGPDETPPGDTTITPLPTPGAALEKPEESAGPVLSKQKPAKKPSQKKPEEKKTAQSGATVSPPSAVWGVRIGVALDEELTRAQGEGLAVEKESTTDKYGVRRFPFTPKITPFPSSVRSQAASEFYHIEGYKGTILKVHGMVKTKLLPKPLEWKKATFDAVVDEYSKEHGKPAILTDQGTSSEAAWLLPERRVLWVFIDAGLDNTCQVQISYVDRRIQAGHLIGILK